MSKEQMVKIFDDMGGDTYDKNNSFFSPINKNLNFLIDLILKDLPSNARILCVGVGTGADIIDLANNNKSWSFVGIDPAKSMLDRCEVKLRENSLQNRCELFHGYLSDFKTDESFDAVLCLYVMHFLKDLSERAQMYSLMAKHLKPDGHLIDTQITVDFSSKDYQSLLENWKNLHGLAGSSKEKLNGMNKVLEEQLGVLSPSAVENLILNNGFRNATTFFQAFLIKGWHARKS